MHQSSAGGFNRRLAPQQFLVRPSGGEITGGAASTKMLQTNMLKAEKTRSPQTGPGYSDDAGSGGMGELVDFALGFLRRQYLVIILTAVFAMTSCIIYLRITPPTYTGARAGPSGKSQGTVRTAAVDTFGASLRPQPDRDPDPAAQIERARNLGDHSA